MFTRLASFDDIPQIMQLIHDVVPAMIAAGNFQWDNTYPNAEVFEQDIILAQLWVAEIDDTIAGISAITTDQYPEYAEAGLDIDQVAIVTHRLAVSPHYRGRGVAEALLLQAETVAKKRHINILRVDTNSENQATQRLFPKIGYRYTGEMGLSFRPGMRFFCYEKVIG